MAQEAAKIPLERFQIRTILLYEFMQGKTATEAHQQMCHVLGAGTLSYGTATAWFSRFKEGDLTLQDRPRGKLDEARLLQMVTEDPTLSLERMAEELDVCRRTVEDHLHDNGFTWDKQWIPPQ